MSRTFKLTIAYDGTDFAGWQVQPERETIQGALQRALLRVTGQSVQVVGSGRTDAGVHAIAQVASCVLNQWRHSAEDLVPALNRHLPCAIVVEQAVEVASGFHAIRDAIGKRYRYQLQLGGPRCVFEYRYRWMLRGSLNLGWMEDAATRLVGVHNFASFQASGSDRKTTTRHVRACELLRQPTSAKNRTHLAIEVEADGFLYNMVRNIVGTLVEVGREKRTPDSIDEVLQAKSRRAAGPTAPAHGLFLVRVDYPAIERTDASD